MNEMEDNDRFIKNILTFLKFINNEDRLKILNFLGKNKLTQHKIIKNIDKDESEVKKQLNVLMKGELIQKIEKNDEVIYKTSNKEIVKIIKLINAYCSKLNWEKLSNIGDFDRYETLM